MKSLSTIFFLLVFAGTAYSAVHTVDNNQDSPAQFTDLTSAMNSASAGDTLLVHPSGIEYGNITVNKQIVFIGPGHNPEVSSGLPATIGQFSMASGSSGSVIEGFCIIGGINGALWSVSDDITIRNNYIKASNAISSTFGDGSGSDNWLIEGNIIEDPLSCGGCRLINVSTSVGGSHNWIFRNNYIYMPGASGNKMFDNLNSTSLFVNNIIVYANSNDMFEDSNFPLFENNIFWCTSSNLDIDLGCSDCIFNNNLFYNPNNTLDDIPGTENLMNTDPLFENFTGVAFQYSDDYHFQAGSPALTAGSDDGELGVYGNNYNFRMEGYAADNPRITHVNPQYIAVPINTEFTIEIGTKRAGL